MWGGLLSGRTIDMPERGRCPRCGENVWSFTTDHETAPTRRAVVTLVPCGDRFEKGEVDQLVRRISNQ